MDGIGALSPLLFLREGKFPVEIKFSDHFSKKLKVPKEST